MTFHSYSISIHYKRKLSFPVSWRVCFLKYGWKSDIQYVKRRDCIYWNSGIVHAAWNVVIIGGGLAIGEKIDPYSVMTYVLDSKSFAITGGEFGIESSVISLIGYIIVVGIACMMITSRKKNRV